MAQAITKLSPRPSASTGGSGGGVGTVVPPAKPSRLLEGLEGLSKIGAFFLKRHAMDEAAEFREVKAQQKAASKAFSASVQIGMEDQLSQNFIQFPDNPGANKEKGEALINGVVSTLPELARPVFMAKGTKSLNEKIAKANQNAIQRVRDNSALQAANLEDQLAGRRRAVAKNIFSDDDGLRLAAVEELISVQGEILVPFMETFEDFEGNEFGFTDKQINEKVNSLYVMSVEDGTEGWFDSQENMGVAYQRIVDGDFKIPNATGEGKFSMVDVLGELPDNGRSMLARLNTKMTARNAVAAENEKVEKEITEKEQDTNLFQDYLSIEDPSGESRRITPNEIEEQVLAGELDPIKAIPLLKAATAPEVINNDPLLFNILTSMLLADQDIETFLNNSDGRLKKETLFSLRTKNKTNQDRLAGVVQSELESLIKQEERSMVKILNTVGLFGVPDPILNERIAEATTEYNRRVDAGEDPVEVRRELTRRYRGQALNNDEFTKSLIKPRFMPMTRDKITPDTLKQGAGRLVTNFKAGKVNKAEFNIQKKLFREWVSQIDKREEAKEAAALEEARKKTDGK